MAKEISTRRVVSRFLTYAVLILIGALLIYPFLWLVGSSFKDANHVFTESVIPANPTLSGYIEGWKGTGSVSFATFFLNTAMFAVLRVAATVVSATIVAYGFARFTFPFKKLMLSVLIATLLFPKTVILVPSYIIFTKLNWVDSYKPLIVPSLFAADTYFVYLMIQFFRGLPRDMDEAAEIDGCGPVKRLLFVLLPMIKPAMVTCVLFQFIWTSNDFLDPMIYLSTETKFPVSIGLKVNMDASTGEIAWTNILAMSVLAILPPLVLFSFCQRYFIEGIATTGMKN